MYVPVAQGTASFELGSAGGKPQIRGTSTVALCAGFYHYLKYYANCSVSVGAQQLALPATLPLPPPSAHPSPMQFHWFGSFMANSYTQAFWAWERWAAHLDWCALMGFDLVMVYAGAEHVHAEVYLEMGLAEEDLRSFFSGAAFLGWSSTRAGNIRGLAGPISPAWRANKAELGKKIVARCRELGITPVLSGFNGHVPEALVKRLHPHANHTRARPWNGFYCTDVGSDAVASPLAASPPAVAPPYGCGFELEPTDPLFLEVGARFIRKQAETFGDDLHFFAAVQFTEEIPSAQSTLQPTANGEYLAAWGHATYAAMANADSEAVWVLDGWFANANGEPWFWCGANKTHAQHYLSLVPVGTDSLCLCLCPCLCPCPCPCFLPPAPAPASDSGSAGGILILDLAADWTEHWRDPSFFGHPFIWCQFHENGEGA